MFFEWWNSLGVVSQIFFCIALPSTLVLIIQTVMMLVGIGGEDGGADELPNEVPDDVGGELPDGDVTDGVYGDALAEGDPDPSGLEGLKVFTIRGIISFLVVFGWVGIAMDRAGAKLWLTIPVALVSGVIMMLLIALLTRAVMKLRSDGTVDNRNAIGTAGRVQLTIPPARSGEGKVHLMLQGAYVERSAVTDETEAIPTGAEIVVVGISGQTDLVVRRK